MVDITVQSHTNGTPITIGVSLQSSEEKNGGRTYKLSCEDNFKSFPTEFFKTHYNETDEESWEEKLEKYMEMLKGKNIDLDRLFPYEISNDISYVNAVHSFFNNILGLHGVKITEPEVRTPYW